MEVFSPASLTARTYVELMVCDPNFPRLALVAGLQVCLSDSRTEDECLRGSRAAFDLLTTAATSSFSIILGVSNVICLTPQVEQIIWKDALQDIISALIPLDELSSNPGSCWIKVDSIRNHSKPGRHAEKPQTTSVIQPSAIVRDTDHFFVSGLSLEFLLELGLI
ncbi:MAG: hypothetical protein JST28_22135 [Acidobacteria bacterium]|nr:hypothetical protein [Acidobacteriota bacterium]